jgi:hypothetical protein
MEMDYLGVVIAESLSDPDELARLPVVASKRSNEWTFLLVSVEPDALDSHVSALQAAMRSDEAWYNHYFRDDELIVVFKKRVFTTSVDPGAWTELVDYGLAQGIPRGELDFEPRTLRGAEEVFGVSLEER